MTAYGITADQLRSYIERIERLEEEKKNISQDVKEVFAEAKGNGFDVKTMRTILRLRKIDANDLQEQEYLLDTYKRALGMLPEVDEEEQAQGDQEEKNKKVKQAQAA
jgi:uncharacterized protein (UPF0335 family)